MYHTVTIVGNVGRPPEMRFTPSGVAVTNFNVATTRKYTNKAGAQVDETIWFRISAWGKLAEICQQYIDTGKAVLVTGELQGDENGNPRTFQRKDGSTGASFEVRANVVRFIGKSNGQSSGQDDSWDTGPEEEDLPF